MKLTELLTEASKGEVEEITVTDQGDGKFLVNTKAKSGATIDAIVKLIMQFSKKAGVEILKKSGGKMENAFSSRPTGFVAVFKKPEGAEDVLKAAVEKASGAVQKAQKSDAAYKAKAPERAKEKSAYAAEKRKLDMAKYDKLYGKGTWNRVTYKQEGGDDGYQYVVRVDGKPVMNGLTQREAMYHKESAVKELAKTEKLGQYAK